MGVGMSILLIAAGAILTWAVNASVSGLEIQTIGVILLIVGIVGLVSAGVMLALALARRPEAGLAAVAVGFGTVLGLVAVHLAPEWGAASDPYPDLDLNALSWLLVALPMAAAAWLGALGLRKLRAGPLPN